MTLASDGLYNAKPYKYTFADATARAAATGFTAAEVGVFALQLDDLSLWILADDSPVTWSAAAGAAGMTNPMTTAGDVIVGGASGTPTRVAKGGNNTVLGVDGSGTLGYKADPVAAADVIDEVVLSADATSVRFPASGSLPTGYRHAELVIEGRLTDAAVDAAVSLQFNGDTGSNYDRTRLLAGDVAPAAGGDTLAATSMQVGILPANTAGANRSGQIRLHIAGHERTTFYKSVEGRSVDMNSTSGTGRSLVWEHSGLWRSTAAITSITAIGNFKAGTVLTLYGKRGLSSPRTS